jgi:dienelactone hydrolase
LSTPQSSVHPVAGELPPHGYAITKPVPGSDIPADYTFVLTRDEIYVPIAVRKPPGAGPFPCITMGRGNGRGGMPLIEQKVALYSTMQDRMIARGYVVVYVNYRNEIPYHYETRNPARNVADDIANEGRTLKSTAIVDHDDLQSIIQYLRTLPYVKPDKVGCVGVSHGGETILKAASERDFTCGVAIEGASHEFLTVDTGPNAPRIGSEVQYNDIEVVRKNANKARAMERIRRINTPILHIGRDKDHLQGIFKLAHEWMVEAGKDSTWASFDHPDHGYPFIERGADGSYNPNREQQAAFDLFMNYFEQRLK